MLCSALPLDAQRFEPSFQLGFRTPIGGDLVVPVPTPGGVGFTRGLLRLDLPFRAYSLRAKWSDTSLTQVHGEPETAAVRDLRLMLGWSF